MAMLFVYWVSVSTGIWLLGMGTMAHGEPTLLLLGAAILGAAPMALAIAIDQTDPYG